jgi:hypothetical protein
MTASVPGNTGNMLTYLSRVTSEHRNQPKFIATLVATLQPLIDIQAFLNQLYSQFDLDNAVGAQLDQVGLWIGFSRTLKIPLASVFFTWDTAGLGWDQGAWFGPFDPTTGLVMLSDVTYRAVLQLKVAYNATNGTNQAISAILLNIFPTLFPGVTIKYVDGQNMTMAYTMTGSYTPLIKQLFLQGLLTVRPMGVSATYTAS